jgi:cytochrome c-type biogenesis protein CcmF
VHAFAESPIGYWFMVFMVITLAVCIFTYILQYSHLKSERPVESLVSRESAFLFNNLVLLAACFVILWGALFPVLSEYFVGNKVTFDAAWYNRIAVPIGLFLLMMAGVGPLLPWRSTSLKSIKRNFVLPVIALWAAVIACLVYHFFSGTGFAVLVTPHMLAVLCVRMWHDRTFDQSYFYALVAFALSAGVLTAICSEFLRGARVIAKQSGRNYFWSIFQLIRRNTRRYGGYTVHVGVVIVVIGLAGAAFNRSVENELALHDKLVIGPYTLEYVGPTQDANANFDSEYAQLDVYKTGIYQLQMTPGKRIYLASQQPQTMVAIHSVPAWDLYVVYEGTNPDTGQPIIKAFLNPLVSWIWAGALLMIVGTLIALTPSQKPAANGLSVASKVEDISR